MEKERMAIPLLFTSPGNTLSHRAHFLVGGTNLCCARLVIARSKRGPYQKADQHTATRSAIAGPSSRIKKHF